MTDNQIITPPTHTRCESHIPYLGAQPSPDSNRKRYRLGNYVLIFLILLLFGISLALRTYHREIVSDDLLYGYILDEHPLGENDYSVKVENLSDAIKSQKAQYFYSNGRFIVHVLVQMFAGAWGNKAYSVFLALLGTTIICLFIRYSIVPKYRLNPFIWFLLLFTYLYLFQSFSRSWFSFAGGMNYMYPMMWILLFLLVFNKLDRTNKFCKPIYVILILLGLITGWSQECFSIPLSGALF
ncbi:MAG: hypothetical protein J1E29_04635, partial [Duncaniella sp.]|nr:hypothetical protein [Duncaniella sp.]